MKTAADSLASPTILGNLLDSTSNVAGKPPLLLSWSSSSYSEERFYRRPN
jgi:hypothetical protein